MKCDKHPTIKAVARVDKEWLCQWCAYERGLEIEPPSETDRLAASGLPISEELNLWDEIHRYVGGNMDTRIEAAAAVGRIIHNALERARGVRVEQGEGLNKERLAWLLSDVADRLPHTDVGRERYVECMGAAAALREGP